MNVPFLDLRRQTDLLEPELAAAAARVAGSGRFILGDELARFERAYADYCGVEHAVGVANGTDAITIGLQALGIGEGDEVITAANTCVPTVAGIEAAGATARLVDVDGDTRTLATDRVAEAVGPETRAIVAVHLYGHCADLDGLGRLAEKHELVLLEDCAQAHGATYRGRHAGSIGHAGAFSFYPTKNLGALGDAGAIVTSDAEVAHRARLLRNYGERERFEHVLRGWNSRLDELQAAVLTVKLEHLPGWVRRRRMIAAAYDAALGGSRLRPPSVAEGTEHAYHLYVVEAAEREAFRQRLAASGIGTAVHYPRAVHQQPAYCGLGDGRALDVSEGLAARVVSLPLYPELTDSEVDYVCATLAKVGG